MSLWALRSPYLFHCSKSKVRAQASWLLLALVFLVSRPTQQLPHRLSGDLLDVVLVLEQHAEGGVDGGGVERHAVERQQRARPVDGLGDARGLEEVGAAQALH